MIDRGLFFVNLKCQGISVNFLLLLVFFVVCVSLLFKNCMIFYYISDMLSRIHVASCKNIISVSIINTFYCLRVLSFLYCEGFIEGFRVMGPIVLVFLKKFKAFLLFKDLKIVSTPGRRQYWTLVKLMNRYSYSNFAGIYGISSSKGLISSFDALLRYRIGGEVLFKISV